jgi:DNA-binding MarR family transcriptional regulator
MKPRAKTDAPEDGSLCGIAVSNAEALIDRLSTAGLDRRGENDGTLPQNKLIDLACRIYEMRRGRSRYFHNNLFGEPVWDMLLVLFCVPAFRWRKLTVSSLCEAAGVPATTGMRWSKLMEQKGLVERTRDPLDRRRIYLSLTATGEKLMCDYLSSVYHRVVGS